MKKVLIVGSCLAQGWTNHIQADGLVFEYLLTNNFSRMPERPPSPIGDYDFQIAQIPLRCILHENSYSHLSYAEIVGHERLFESATAALSQYLDIVLAWNEIHGLLTFVTNFLVPQQCPLGRLLPRHDPRNMVHFVERLNGHLYEQLARRTNAYLLDIDQISATLGRRTLQDDGVWTLSHGSVLNDSEYERDQHRIQPPPRLSEHYPAIAHGQEHFYRSAWAELQAMLRTIRRVDSVKLVIFDLDDTLWRGVVAEESEITSDTIEGWPVGLMEAACFLKQRGILLAINSRNDEATIVALFDRIAGGRLRLDDFACRRINWRPKHENVRDILEELHLTPHSTVFVDDNPVERAAVQASFPDIRTLGAHPYYLRRILLWSPETQLPTVTAESARRTEMIQAHIARDTVRAAMSRQDFLATLDLRINICEICSTEDGHFPRILELIGKTNQFNTTGRRLTRRDCEDLFQRGVVFHAFDLQDRFSCYGLVGAEAVEECHILQLVMSCRVLGLGAEDALLAHVAAGAAARGCSHITADFAATPLNALARDFYDRRGFVEVDGVLRVSVGDVLAAPSHLVTQ